MIYSEIQHGVARGVLADPTDADWLRGVPGVVPGGAAQRLGERVRGRHALRPLHPHRPHRAAQGLPAGGRPPADEGPRHRRHGQGPSEGLLTQGQLQRLPPKVRPFMDEANVLIIHWSIQI